MPKIEIVKSLERDVSVSDNELAGSPTRGSDGESDGGVDLTLHKSDSIGKRVPTKSAAIPVNGIHNGNAETNGSPVDAKFNKFLKNSRNSRSRFGKGLAKKGGGGGKGTWGKICEEYDDAGFLDANDPNYDEDNLANCKLEVINPVLNEEEIDKYVKPIISEYYEHGNTEEVISQLEDFNFGTRRFQVAVIAVQMAMERKSSYREMTSVLISDLYGRLLTGADLERAYDTLLHILPDLMLDTPNADVVLGKFIARSVADDCLAPIYVQRGVELYTEKPRSVAMKQANHSLTTRNALINVDTIWGIAGGMRPVKYLVKEMQSILEEFVVTNIKDEAGAALKELEVPHFHHEFVYEAIVKAIEDSKDPTIDHITLLLKYLYDACIITSDQIKNGFLRVFEEMDDIVIDVPFAFELLEKIKSKSEALGFYPEGVDLPQRGRKRFVSEGDGGLIKA